MSINEIKNYSTNNGWDALVKHNPDLQAFSERKSFGKRQGLELYLKGYEAKIQEIGKDKS